jgi:hypothetical protein
MRSVATLIGMLLLSSMLPAAVGAATYSISGTVTNASGAGVSGIEVWVCPLAPPAGETTIMCLGSGGVSANDGTYTVSGVPSGTFKVSFNDPQDEYPYGYYGQAGYTGDWAEAATVTIGTAGITGISIQYPPISTISGTVTGPDGVPLVGVQIVACSVVPPSGCGNATTTRDGHYRVAVAVGTYTVQAYDNTGAYIPTYATTETGAPRVVESSTNPTGVDIRFAPARHISGKIRAAVNGQWQFVNVFACGTGPTPPTCYNAGTNQDSTFRVAVPAGTYTLSFVDFGEKVLSGYWSTKGLVSTVARATKIDVNATDFTAINAVTGPIVVGAHAGTARTGAFSTKLVTVRRGSSVTVRFTVGKGFAGTKVSIWTAIAASNGKFAAFRKTTSTTVRSDGYVYYTVKVKGLMAFRLQASLSVADRLPVTLTSPTVKAKGS